MSRTNVVRMAAGCIFAYVSVACSSTTPPSPASGGSSPSSGGSNPGSPGGSGTVGSSGGTAVGSSGNGSGGTSSTSGGSGTIGSGGAGTSGGASPSGGASTGGSGSVTPSGVAVKLDATHQTIQGFGINTALMPGTKSIPVDKLFTTTGADAIGLSILRVGMNSDGSLTGPFISEARAKNADLKVIGSCWSPPAGCKSNKDTTMGGHLVDDDGGKCFESW